MDIKKYELIKPIIHPKMKIDEAPVSYLTRLAEENFYKNFRWLINCENRKTISPLSLHLYKILEQGSWTGFNTKNKFYNQIKNVSRHE